MHASMEMVAATLVISLLAVTFVGAADAQDAGSTGAQTPMAGAIAPFNVGSQSQLFVDRVLVGSAEGVSFALYPATKHPAGPWLYHDETRSRPAGPMVIYDEEAGLFRSWSTNAYNTSPDGLNWGPREENDESWRYLVRIAMILDRNDPDPARRYKVLAFGPSREFPPGLKDADTVTNPDGTETLFWYCKGYNTFTSPDGRSLTHLSERSILLNDQGRAPGDMLNACYDRRLNRYVAFLKMTSRESRFTRRRSFAVLTSEDFEHWSEPNLALVADQLDDDGALARLEEVRPLLAGPIDPQAVERSGTHVYGIGGPYQQESCTIVFPWLLTVSGSVDGKHDGPSEVQLAVSRDLEHWQRPFRTAAIPRGTVAREFPEGSDEAYANSDWDSCWFNGVGPGLDVGDEVWVYYAAYNTPHGHPHTFRGSPPGTAGTLYHKGIGIAVWKRDRFVSVDAPATGGTLTTVPVTFTGSRLELNAATGGEGQIVIELLDEQGESLGRSKPFSGDDLRHHIEWQEPLDLAALAGRPVVLRFLMSSARLYAFAFRD